MRVGYTEMDNFEETYDVSLEYLDIQLDMTCNLACLTCGPEFSTTWRNELKIKNLSVRPRIEEFLIEKFSGVDLSGLKEVRIWGGEPFLTYTHKKILEFISAKIDTSNVRLMYNTNGTCRIDKETRELIEKFKFARISFSIDGIGDRFNYIRYPAKWDEVESNLLWWRENLPHNSMLSMTVTASVLNVLYLDEVFDWHREHFSKSIFSDPIEIYVHNAFGEYGLENMPVDMVDGLRSIKGYCQPWIQHLNISKPTQNGLDTIRKKIKEADVRRGLNLADVLPLTAKFLDYH